MVIANPKEGSQAQNGNTKQRLIDAAVSLFSEKGYKGTSVRRIAAAANCNIAAVNYHFGNKQMLYVELWRRQFTRLRDVRLEGIEKVMKANQPSLEELLWSFAQSFLGPLLEDQKFMKLMAHEINDKRLPTEMFVKEIVKPTVRVMHNAMLLICPGLDESKIPLLLMLVVGQLIHVLHTKTIFDQIELLKIQTMQINDLIENIVKFSAAGIRAYIKSTNG